MQFLRMNIKLIIHFLPYGAFEMFKSAKVHLRCSSRRGLGSGKAEERGKGTAKTSERCEDAEVQLVVSKLLSFPESLFLFFPPKGFETSLASLSQPEGQSKKME